MSCHRFSAKTVGLLWLASAMLSGPAAHTQSQQQPSVPAATPAPATQIPSYPAATPVSGANLPSVPAATPMTSPPAAVPTPQQVPARYSDPLEAPIPTKPVPAAPAQQPASPSTATPSPATPQQSYLPSMNAYDNAYVEQHHDHLGSTYIPVDSPIYPMAMRLYSLGYLDTAFVGLRPWTRRSLLHMLHESEQRIVGGDDDQAVALLADLESRLKEETPRRGEVYGVDSVYTRLMGINGQTLRDSYHLGQTIVNDYGRPYEPGFNALAGFSSTNEWGRFSLYVRGEYEHSPAGAGYSAALDSQLSNEDGIPVLPQPNGSAYNTIQSTIPYLNTGAQNPFQLQEATLSFHVLGHEISGGKSDAWLGPGMGGGMAWSNNAEDIYSFRINRVEPMHIPYLSAVLGPLRYDFFVGSLKGHTAPNSPWVHSEQFSFRPTSNFEFGFQRSVIWGGEGHEPVTLHTFFRSFFDFNDTEADPSEKLGAQDPGARFSAFNFSWRLPFLSHYVTLYTDSIAHDDVTPPSAPRRAAYRPGIYLSQFPGMPKLDLRVEGVSTDTSTLRSLGGYFNYFEGEQHQGYTNKGFIMGDWIGREAKGGQAWLTYHLSPGEWIQLEYLNKKTPKDFIAGGVTQNQFKVDVMKRIRRDVQLDAWVQYERWKAPVPQSILGEPLEITGGPLYFANAQSDTVIAAQFTWYPKLRTSPFLNGK